MRGAQERQGDVGAEARVGQRRVLDVTHAAARLTGVQDGGEVPARLTLDQLEHRGPQQSVGVPVDR